MSRPGRPHPLRRPVRRRALPDGDLRQPDRRLDRFLTIHGVTRHVPLVVSFEGYVPDPWGGHRAIFSARTTVNREDFGITWNVALEAGGLLVSKDVRIEIELETVLASQ